MTSISRTSNPVAPEFTRQRDWFDPEQHADRHVAVIGCGGIGSPTAVALTSLGIQNISLVDFDFVEPHNLPSQMFGAASVGDLKVMALADLCDQLNAIRPETFPCKLQDADDALHGIVVSGLDNMQARKDLWEQVKGNIAVERLVDARLGGQMFNILTVNPMDPTQYETYEENLFDDEEMEELPCTAQGIIDVGFLVASRITQTVRRILLNEDVKKIHIENAEKQTVMGA